MTPREILRKVLPWVGRHFPDGVCPFCDERLVTDFHRTDCILYEQSQREWKVVYGTRFKPKRLRTRKT